jgi:polysaccharide biosynthesis/export protein
MQNSKKTFSHRENIVCPVSGSVSPSPCGSQHVLLYIYQPVKVAAYLCCIMLFITFSSCSPTKQQVYFQNLQKDTTLRNIITPAYELKIRKSDLLGITVASLSPDVAFYNAPQNAVGPLNGYFVDDKGNISFVKLGAIHVEGMTRKDLKDSLERALVPYLKDAIVSVGFLNRHVTMLGGVSPQILQLANDNMTILDALAASGDIGDKGKMDNILVIRDTGNAKIFKRLNLKDNSIFYSPYFYLQPNDIVYVEPAKIKTKLSAPQLISYITTGISLVFLILNALKL